MKSKKSAVRVWLFLVPVCWYVFVNGVCAETANWPRFRGPNGQGVSTASGIPVKWTDQNILWTVDLDGTGHSSPVIWNNKVYVTFADQNTFDATIEALNLADGKELWRKHYSMSPVRINKLNSPAVSTPAVDADGVYALWAGAKHVLATGLNHDGVELWKTDLGPVHLQHGYSTSPIVYNDKVIFSVEQEKNEDNLKSYWYALDKRTGKIIWRTERDNSSSGSSSTPCVYRSTDGTDLIVFSSCAHGITAVDPKTGSCVWEAPTAVPARSVSSPVLVDSLIACTCGKGGGGVQLTLLRPPSGETKVPQIVHAIKGKFVPYVSTPIAVNGKLFMFHDQGWITCLDVTTGKVLWIEKPGGKFYGSPVLVGDRIYCVTRTGQVVVVKAADTYELLAINDLGETSHATPAIAEGQLIVRTLSHVYCIGDKP